MRVRRAPGTGRSCALAGATVLASVAASLLALPAQGASASCPLTMEQQVKAIHAFKPIAAFVTREPRCFNCHGGVNPHIEGTGPDAEDPGAPESTTEHGGGRIPRTRDRAADGTLLIEGSCAECHNDLAPRRDGSRSVWMTAPGFLSFVNKDATTLCRQFKRSSHSAAEFIGHLRDDNGGNNFSGTAFRGDRGLDKDLFADVVAAPPSLPHGAVMRLGQDWIDAMGGSFQGDEGCGCEVRLQGEFTYTESAELGPFSDVLQLTGKLTWTLQEEESSQSAAGDAGSLLFKPTTGEITVESKFHNRGWEGKSHCAGGGARTFPVERMHRNALRHMRLEILPDGRYTLRLVIPDRPDPFPEWRYDAQCVWPNVTDQDEVPVHSVAMVLGDLQGRLEPDGNIVGTLAAPIRRGPHTITGSWSFKPLDR